MNEPTIYNILIIVWFVLAAAVFVSLFFFVAPYGRYLRKGWGPSINDTLAWVIMEAGSPLIFAACFLVGKNPVTFLSFIFLVLWELHYLHRAFIYPFTRRGTAENMPLTVLMMGFVFNMVNGYLNGRYLFTFSPGYDNAWLKDPRFIVGIVLLVVGFIINRQADTVLRNLRKPHENDYKIPYGSLYNWISCPNYLGELLIWIGWAIATWSLAGLAFSVWTAANLIPRAYANHQWYREQFPDYPVKRKALIPGIW
jgi:3-oxo-5-alpha-steroid 4-dehydrogenase 1